MTDPISRIEAALARLGAEHEPPQGWEAKVLAATVDRKQPRWRWGWLWWVPVPAAALAALVLVLWPSASSMRRSPWFASTAGVDVDGERAGVRRAASSLSVGDVLTARATHDQVHGALWIYRDGGLQLACPRDPGCWSFAGQTIAALKLTRRGEYKIVSLTSEREIPMPRGDYGQDVAVAKSAGATELERLTTVN